MQCKAISLICRAHSNTRKVQQDVGIAKQTACEHLPTGPKAEGPKAEDGVTASGAAAGAAPKGPEAGANPGAPVGVLALRRAPAPRPEPGANSAAENPGVRSARVGAAASGAVEGAEPGAPGPRARPAGVGAAASGAVAGAKPGAPGPGAKAELGPGAGAGIGKPPGAATHRQVSKPGHESICPSTTV